MCAVFMNKISFTNFGSDCFIITHCYKGLNVAVVASNSKL